MKGWGMISRLLGRKRDEPKYQMPVDMMHLDESFNLLCSTATEVSVEASKAAKALEDQTRRIKACFEALNSASDIIFIVDADRNVYFCNDRFVEEFGFCCYTDAVDKCVCDVVPGMKCTDKMWKTVKKNKTYDDIIGKYKLTIVPMMNGVPDPIYYICTMKPTVTNQ